MSTQHSTLVAVFRDRAMAEQAIERLQDAGFQNNQLHYSGGNTRAGVLSAIKHLFMGEDYPTSKNLVGDLENMDIPNEEAEYYAREHQAGHPIVAIDAGEHVREAEEILTSNGAYHYGMNSGAANDLPQKNEDDYGQSGEGENTSGYAQTDNALRGVDSTQSPMSSMPQNRKES